jgi:hypothetical protein
MKKRYQLELIAVPYARPLVRKFSTVEAAKQAIPSDIYDWVIIDTSTGQWVAAKGWMLGPRENPTIDPEDYLRIGVGVVLVGAIGWLLWDKWQSDQLAAQQASMTPQQLVQQYVTQTPATSL